MKKINNITNEVYFKQIHMLHISRRHGGMGRKWRQSRDVNKHGGGVYGLYTGSDVECQQRCEEPCLRGSRGVNKPKFSLWYVNKLRSMSKNIADNRPPGGHVV